MCHLNKWVGKNVSAHARTSFLCVALATGWFSMPFLSHSLFFPVSVALVRTGVTGRRFHSFLFLLFIWFLISSFRLFLAGIKGDTLFNYYKIVTRHA